MLAKTRDNIAVLDDLTIAGFDDKQSLCAWLSLLYNRLVRNKRDALEGLADFAVSRAT